MILKRIGMVVVLMVLVLHGAARAEEGVRALGLDPDFNPARLERSGDMPFLGILFKKSGELDLVKRTLDAGRT